MAPGILTGPSISGGECFAIIIIEVPFVNAATDSDSAAQQWKLSGSADLCRNHAGGSGARRTDRPFARCSATSRQILRSPLCRRTRSCDAVRL